MEARLMNFFFNNNDLGSDRMNRLADLYSTAPQASGSDPAATFAKAMARSQLEIWALANRRARAALAFPSQLAASRTPDAFVGAYVDFWKTAFTECADTTHRIGGLFSAPVEQNAVPAIQKERPAKAKKPKSEKAVRLNGAHNPNGGEYRQAS